jgi:X-X-X-Leu-X-X-Gly heptad repeat protein
VVEGAPDQVPRIDLPSGPVTLEPLDSLAAQLNQLDSEAKQILQSSETPIATATLKVEQAGELLMSHKTEWDTSAVANQITAATQLQDGVSQLNQQIQDLASRTHSGLGGFLHSLTDGHHEHELEAQRSKVLDQLHTLLATFVDQVPARTIPEADALRAEAQLQLAQAKSLIDEQHAKIDAGKAIADEIQRRRAAMKVMGFDSLYTAAWLQTHGPTPVASPLTLKPKEDAYVSVLAVLARQTTRTRYAGGSQGFSFPIGHTGIRYRVGSFNGHPVQSSSITDIDEGTLVLTNMRIAFIGKLKSVVTQLPKLVHVELYNDALSVFQEGRENPNFYKIAAPQYFLFYVNWILDHNG